ncbi:hypothetical protein GCM10025791_05360 [Halioxenophilus aromaticivorans]|uniref:Uncharacterized protein n=2 Tax=Halioxenophilus aromaticivorans TaxID=1306992 RepID=A0AAV3TXP9_9ALTE
MSAIDNLVASSMSQATPTSSELIHWQQQWQADVVQHFTDARLRVDRVYAEHFASLKAVYHRHWRHRGDVPKDLLNLPRALWRLVSAPIRKNQPQSQPAPTGKEMALIEVINTDLLAMPELQAKFHQQLKSHPNYQGEALQELEALLKNLSPEEAHEKLQIAVERLRLSHEGTRDLFLFVSLGLLSRSLADKVAFGGAAAVGSSLATSAYLSQKSFLGALWAGWFGAPSWVATAGAVGGIGLVILATPVISPLTETGINRLRAKKILRNIVDETETQVRHAKFDIGSSAGQIATYMQMLPDIVQLLKQLR